MERKIFNLDLNFDFSEETSEFERNISTLGLLALLNEIEKKEQLKKRGFLIEKKFCKERCHSIGCTEELKKVELKSSELKTQSEPSSFSNLALNITKSSNGDKFDGFVFNTDLSKEVDIFDNTFLNNENTDVINDETAPTVSDYSCTNNKTYANESPNDGLILINDNYLIPLVISEGEIEEKNASKAMEKNKDSMMNFDSYMHDISPGLYSEDEFSSSDNEENGVEIYKDKEASSSENDFSDGSNEFDASCEHTVAPTAKFDDNVNFLGLPASNADSFLLQNEQTSARKLQDNEQMTPNGLFNVGFPVREHETFKAENNVGSDQSSAATRNPYSISDNSTSLYLSPSDNETGSYLRMSSSLNHLNKLRYDSDLKTSSSQTPLYSLRRRSTESRFALAENVSSSWSSIEDIEAVACLFDLERQRLNKLFKIDAINHSINVITKTLKLNRSKNDYNHCNISYSPSNAQNLLYRAEKRNSALIKKELLKSEVEIVKKSIELLEKDILGLHNSINSITSDHRKDFCTILRKSELLEEKRRRFEDLEFSLVELESKCESDTEDNLLSDLSINGSHIRNKEETNENNALKMERQELLNHLTKEHRHLAMIEKKMHRLKKRFDDTFRMRENNGFIKNDVAFSMNCGLAKEEDGYSTTRSHIIPPMPVSYFRWKKGSPDVSQFYDCESRISCEHDLSLRAINNGTTYLSERIRPLKQFTDTKTSMLAFENQLKEQRRVKKNNSQPQILYPFDGYRQAEDAVKLRFPSKKQERPLTRYLPVAASDFNLEQHVENAGHFIDPRSGVIITKSTCSGYLIKMGQKFRTWHKRWFVFDRNKRHLAYYSDYSYEEKEPRGRIDFQSICEVYVDHLNSVRSPCPRNTFVVKTITRPFYLVAPSVEAMRVWVDVIITGAEGHLEYQA